MIKKLGIRQKYFLADIRRKNSQIYANNLYNNLVSAKFCVKILRSLLAKPRLSKPKLDIPKLLASRSGGLGNEEGFERGQFQN